MMRIEREEGVQGGCWWPDYSGTLCSPWIYLLYMAKRACRTRSSSIIRCSLDCTEFASLCWYLDGEFASIHWGGQFYFGSTRETCAAGDINNKYNAVGRSDQRLFYEVEIKSIYWACEMECANDNGHDNWATDRERVRGKLIRQWAVWVPVEWRTFRFLAIIV